MGREIKRVPLDFDWPYLEDKPWSGYLMPDKFDEVRCPDCENGYSPHAQRLHQLWYGQLPFDPAITGSTPFTRETPAVRGRAERNVASAPAYYNTGESAIAQEAQRLADLFNGSWSHHLTQGDVDALIAGGRLTDLTHEWTRENGWHPKVPAVHPTAREVNEWSLDGFAHDSVNAWVVVRARCERDGAEEVCGTCQGHASSEAYPGQRDEAERWERTEPPSGDGYQLWETVSEGSPITPVFSTPEELATYMVDHSWGSQTNRMASSFEVAMRFIGEGWAPSFVGSAAGLQSGVEAVGA